MEKVYKNHKNEIKKSLKYIWDYMKLNQDIEKCDLIIGCGCANLDIPLKCVQLFKSGYGKKILFAGGVGKITKEKFNKPEALIYQEIALENGIDKKDILIEDKSTNTGDNFRFSLEVLKKNGVKADKILIVHKPLNERRTYLTAKKILKDKDIFITSYDMTFDKYFDNLSNKSIDSIVKEISVIVGDIQRIKVYPQFGWLEQDEIPNRVIEAYYYLKNLGFSNYILSQEEIKNLISKLGIVEGFKENYFN